VPALVSAAAITVNLIASLLLVRTMGFLGLALGTSIAAMANAGALVWLLRRRLGGLGGRHLSITLVKVGSAASVMAFAAVAIQHAMERVAAGAGLWLQSVRLAASIGGGLAVLAITAKLVRLAEFDEAVGIVEGRVRKLLD
jgi:putative peptidoglycan lipid II flippase